MLTRFRLKTPSFCLRPQPDKTKADTLQDGLKSEEFCKRTVSFECRTVNTSYFKDVHALMWMGK